MMSGVASKPIKKTVKVIRRVRYCIVVSGLSGGFTHWIHAMFEHLEPRSSIGFIVEVQLLYHLTREFDATESACRNDILVGHGKFVDVKAFIAVIGDYGLQIFFGIARMQDVFCQSGSGNLQRRATNRADRNSLRVKPPK